MYITQRDIEDRYGSEYVADWSRFRGGPNQAADPNRIQTAINITESMVNNTLKNGPYLIPVVATGDPTALVPEIVEACAELAGHWLWKTRGLNDSKENRALMDARRVEAMRCLLSIRVGYTTIQAVLNTQRRNTPRVGGYPCPS